MRHSLALLVLIVAQLSAAEIADPNAFPRVVGTDVGVQNGIPTTRTNIIDVTNYNASLSDVETTGTITTGTNSLVVASATSWAVGQGITVGKKAILTLTLTSTASLGAFNLALPQCTTCNSGTAPRYQIYSFNTAGGETASALAATIRAYTFDGWVASGSGADIIFTSRTIGERPIGVGYGSATVSNSWVINEAGSIVVASTITAISGTTFTLAGNASASITNGVVCHREDAAISAALAASAEEDIIYLPAGIYNVDNVITMSSYPNRTLRGAGKDATIIYTHIDAENLRIYADSDYSWSRQTYAVPAPSSDNLITAGLTKGSDTITIGNTAFVDSGQTIQIAINNQYDNTEIAAGETFVYSVFGYDTLRRSMHRVTAKTSTTLTITPTVYFTPASNLEARVNEQRTTKEGIGIENLTFSGARGPVPTAVTLVQVRNVWFKNVRITKFLNRGIHASASMFLEIRGSTIDGISRAGTNGAGILFDHVCASLIENNAVYNAGPPLQLNFSSMGNVIGYNFFNAPTYPNMDINHGPHNSYNLGEGNITVGIISDGTFGGSSEDTYFRNWSSGTDFESLANPPEGFNGYYGPFYFNRFAHKTALIGNIAGTLNNPYCDPEDMYDFGSPPGGYDPDAGVNAYDNNFWPQWNNIAELTTRTSDTAGVLTITSGSGELELLEANPFPMIAQPLAAEHTSIGFSGLSQTGSAITFDSYGGTLPEIGATFRLYFGHQNRGMRNVDNAAKPSWWPTTPGTATVIGNYNAASGQQSIPANQALGANTLSDSYYTTKAAMEARGVVWGSLAFPPFDPTNPGTLTQDGWERIPAGYRYMNNGADPPAGAGTQATVTGTLNVTGTITLP